MRLALVVPLAIACRGSTSPADNAGTFSSGSACPLPTPVAAQARFAVGTRPRFVVSGIVGHPGECVVEFRPDDSVLTAPTAGGPQLIAEGAFKGRCAGTSLDLAFASVAPARAQFEISQALHTGETGRDQPVLLDSATPERAVVVRAGVADRCGDHLQIGTTTNVTTWTASPACAKVVKLVPMVGELATQEDLQLVALGPGTCQITAALLGARGDLAVVVK